MAALATRVESRAGRKLTPEEIFEIARAREKSLSRLLILYITSGLAFMLLPGTFLGVWNLVAISSHHNADSVSSGWVQAHGHAQIFGWIGTFILGIGFYSIPKLRRMDPFALGAAWTCWALWTSGVILRWLTGVYLWQWRILLPLSAVFELAAFLIFFQSVSGHRPRDSGNERLESWVLVVIAASLGLLATLLTNFGAAFYLSLRGLSPDLPAWFDRRFLVLETSGFLVPFVWGFSAKRLPIFLGLRPVRGALLCGCGRKLCGRHRGSGGLDDTVGAFAVERNLGRCLRPQTPGTGTAGRKSEGRPHQLSHFRANGVHVGDCGVGTRDMGKLGR